MTNAPRWIPVEESLPDAETPVICTDGDVTFFGMYEAETGLWIMLFGFVPASGVDVTHWHPMPQPPRTIN